MKYNIRFKYVFFVMATAFLMQACTTTDAMMGADSRQEAIQAFQKAHQTLLKQDKLSVSMDVGFEVHQEGGYNLEFGSTRKVIAARPDKIRVEFKPRSTSAGTLVSNGKEAYIFHTKENIYVPLEEPGTIPELVDYLVNDLNVPFPLHELIAAGPDFDIESLTKEAFVVGEEVVEGTKCDHLFFKLKDTHVQVWLDKKEPRLPKRLVIKYVNEPGKPYFWVKIKKWDFSPKVTAGTFTYKPPKDAEKIEFLSVLPESSSETTQYAEGVNQ